MIPSKIYTLVKRYAWVTTANYSETDFLDDINMVKNEIWNKIVASWVWNINYDIWTANTVANQSEYTLPLVSSTAIGSKRIKSISINYDGKTYDNGTLQYIQATEVNPTTLAHPWDYYVNNQSFEKPIFYQSDKSIFIAPLPTSWKEWVNRLRVEWIRNIPDYNINTTEVDMKIPYDYHFILLKGVLPYAYMWKRADIWVINNAINDYKVSLNEWLRTMEDLVEWPHTMAYPTKEEDLLT